MARKQTTPDDQSGEQTPDQHQTEHNEIVDPTLDKGTVAPPIDIAQGEVQTSEQNAPSDVGAENAEDENEGHDGAPYGLRADGTPAKKRGRPPGPANTAAKSAASDEQGKQHARLKSVSPGKGKRPSQIPIAPTALAVVNYQAMGETVAGLFFNVGVMALGEDWEPDTKEGEHLAVAGAFRDYFKSIQAKDLPPGFALVAVLAIYSLKRVGKPTVKSRLQKIGLWFKDNMRIFPKRG